MEYDEADEGVATSDVVQWVALGFSAVAARAFDSCCGEYQNDGQELKLDSGDMSGSA